MGACTSKAGISRPRKEVKHSTDGKVLGVCSVSEGSFKEVEGAAREQSTSCFEIPACRHNYASYENEFVMCFLRSCPTSSCFVW